MKSCVAVADVQTEGSFPAEISYGAEPTKKILLVDDDPVIHLLLLRHFERAGYQVLQVTNGRDAIAVAQRELPLVVVMDVMMPDMDGFTAARELKKDTDLPGYSDHHG